MLPSCQKNTLFARSILYHTNQILKDDKNDKVCFLAITWFQPLNIGKISARLNNCAKILIKPNKKIHTINHT